MGLSAALCVRGGGPLDLPHLTFPKLAGVCQTQDTSGFGQVPGGSHAKPGVCAVPHTGAVSVRGLSCGAQGT